MRVFLLTTIIAVLFVGGPALGDDGAREYQDRSDISQVVYRWGFYRDHGMWDELLDTFHPDGDIQLTWYIGKFEGFVKASEAMAEKGAASSHVMKPPIVEVSGNRAIAITPATIMARANPGVELDVTSNTYFFDFFEKRSGSWKVSKRVCVYQKDRMDSVSPSLRFWFMSWFIDTDKFDPAYKHLGAALESQGFAVLPGQVVDNTEESRKLYEEGQNWLAELDR